jgi:transposase
MAHVRRYFHDVLKADSKNRYAKEAMDFIGRLYKVERTCEPLHTAEKLAERQKSAVPVFNEFRTWLFALAPTVMPGGALGKAVQYTITLLPRLEVFLGNGAVPIDNNRAENSIRPFVVGRKNWLFNDQAAGASDSAALYSVIETAKANGIEPMHYLSFIFRCYRTFGPDAMPWEKLLPTIAIRESAVSIGIPWAIS